MKITKNLLRDLIKEISGGDSPRSEWFEPEEPEEPEQGKWVGGKPPTPPPGWREGGQAANPEDREFQQSHPDVGPMSITRGGAEQEKADAADADLSAAKTLSDAKREWARARRDIKKYIAKGGGPYKNIYAIPKDSSPAGRARKRFARAYTKYRRLKKKVTSKAYKQAVKDVPGGDPAHPNYELAMPPREATPEVRKDFEAAKKRHAAAQQDPDFVTKGKPR